MMEQQKRDRVVKFFSKQFEAFSFATQFCAVICGVQSGKTFMGAYWAGKKILEFPKGIGIIVAPTYGILQQSTLTKFFEIFPQLRKYYKEHKGVIDLPTGGKVFTRSADRPLGIEGITANWWWLDEGGQASRLVWVVLRSRVSMTGGQGLITTTPYSMNWLYQEFFIPWKEGKDKALSVFTWKSIANPFFSKEFYEAERARLRPEEFFRRYEGTFTKMTGLVYDLGDSQIIEPIDIKKKADMRLIGVDWGFNNPAAIVVCYLYDKVWYIVDEWYETGKTTAEIISVLKTKMSEHIVSRIYPDPAEPDRIEECKRAGIPVMPAINDVKGGVSCIQQIIKDKKFFVFNTCKNFIDEINSYHYPEGKEGKPFKDEPEKLNDHILDATRYVIFSYQPIKPQMMKASEPIKPFYPEVGF